jgi:DNA-binding protein HU-beta
MRKSEFIDKVARKAEMSRESAARAVEAIFDTASGTLAEAIRSTGNVSLPGFGRFRAKKRAARRGRNPQTGELIDIPERTIIQFTAGKGLQEILADENATIPTRGAGTQKKSASTAKSTNSRGGTAKKKG